MKSQLKIGVYVISVAVVISMFSCEKDEGPIRITPTPDTTVVYTVSFSEDVQPIFESGSPQCTACHPPSGGNLSLMPLDSYTALFNVTSYAYSPAVLVVPGDTTNSVLWNKINDTGIHGPAMPPPAGGLSSEDIETIGTWIMEGAVDN